MSEMTVTTEFLQPTKTLGERVVVRSPGKAWRIPVAELGVSSKLYHLAAVRRAFPDLVVNEHPNHYETIGRTRVIQRWIVRPATIREAAHAYAIERAEVVHIFITPEHRDEAVAAIEDTYAKAEGDSNDDEIASLQEARDILAAIIGWKHDE